MGTIITIAVYAISSLLVIYCNVQIFGYLLEAKKEKERNEKICTPFNSTINEYESKKGTKEFVGIGCRGNRLYVKN